MDGFIFVGANFRRLNKNDIIVGFQIRGYSIFIHTENRHKITIPINFYTENFDVLKLHKHKSRTINITAILNKMPIGLSLPVLVSSSLNSVSNI